MPESEKGIGQKMKEGIQGAGETAQAYAGMAKDKLTSGSRTSVPTTTGDETVLVVLELQPEDVRALQPDVHSRQPEQKGTGQKIKEGIQSASDTIKEGIQSTSATVQRKLSSDSGRGVQSSSDIVQNELAREKLASESKGYGQIVKEGLQSGLQTASDYAVLAKDKVVSMVTPVPGQKPVTEKVKEGLQSASETAQEYASVAKDKAVVAKDQALSKITPHPQESEIRDGGLGQPALGQPTLGQPALGQVQTVLVPVQAPMMQQQIPTQQVAMIQPQFIAPTSVSYDTSSGTGVYGDRRL